MKFREKIKKVMKEKGFNQAKIAEKTGLTQSAISQILSGHRDGRLANLIKICNCLDVSLSDVFSDAMDVDEKTYKLMKLIDKIIKEYPEFLFIIDAAERFVSEENNNILVRELKNFIII